MSALLLLFLASSAYAQQKGIVATAGVHSDDIIIHRSPTRKEELIGNVRYTSRGMRMSSDWALFEHESKTWQARGGVRLRRQLEDGTVVASEGERARHDQASGKGSLEPKAGSQVTFERTPAEGGEPDHGRGARLDWTGENEAILSGGARIWGPRLEASADSAAYARAARRLTLRGGRPVVRKLEGEWTTALKADEVEAYDSPRRVEARGKVKGWLLFKDPKKLKELGR